MRADFVSQGMNHAEGGWPKVNNVTWLYSWCVLVHMSVYFLCNFCNILPFLVNFGKPWPKNTICARGLELFEEIISGYQSQSISYNINQYHLSISYKYQYQSQDINHNQYHISYINIIQISISISGYQSQWERSDYALPQENWKGREVSGSFCFSSNSNLISILVVIITEGQSAINSIFQYIDQYL